MDFFKKYYLETEGISFNKIEIEFNSFLVYVTKTSYCYLCVYNFLIKSEFN